MGCHYGSVIHACGRIGGDLMLTDGPEDFSRSDVLLLQVERVNAAVDGVSSTISNIEQILDRIEANQKALVERLGKIIDG